MAPHLPVSVDGEGDIAVWAFDHMPALPAGNKSRITSPVQEEHDLFFSSPAGPASVLSVSAQDRPVPIF